MEYYRNGKEEMVDRKLFENKNGQIRAGRKRGRIENDLNILRLGD